MSAINFHTKEIAVKIVYYGPGLCGKTTSLQSIYRSLPEERKNQFVSLATEVDRTIFFDFLPITAYRIRDFVVRLQLYTVPGQVFYNATRKLVLNGVDGLIFVADSQRAMQDSNLESLTNLEENLQDLGMEINEVPMVIQANKRDLVEIYSLEEMDKLYNRHKVPFFATVATTGEGIIQALRTVSQLVVNNLVRKGLGQQLHRRDTQGSRSTPASPSDQGGLSAVAAAAAEAAGPAPEAEVGATLWPEQVHALAERIDRSLSGKRWADAVLHSEALLVNQARRWAETSSYDGKDPVPAFLILRGANSARYKTLTDAADNARKGQPVTKTDAMSALILALESVW